jgi:hypothetical protein
MKKQEIETPALVVDLDAIRGSLQDRVLTQSIDCRVGGPSEKARSPMESVPFPGAIVALQQKRR